MNTGSLLGLAGEHLPSLRSRKQQHREGPGEREEERGLDGERWSRLKGGRREDQWRMMKGGFKGNERGGVGG